MSTPFDTKKGPKATSLLDSNPPQLPSENLRFVVPSTPPSTSTKPQEPQISLQNDNFDLQQYYDNLKTTANCVQSLVAGTVDSEQAWNAPSQTSEYSWQTNFNPNQTAGNSNTASLHSVACEQTSNSSDSTQPTGASGHQGQMPNPASRTDGSTVNSGPSPTGSANFLNEMHPHWFFKVNGNKTADKNSPEKRPSTSSDSSSKKSAEDLEDEHWLPFSIYDSTKLESAYMVLDQNPDIVIQTNGGRYDCQVGNRIRLAVYWQEEPCAIRRGTWFYKKEGYVRFVPYPEGLADELESICSDVIVNSRWNQRIELSNRSNGCLVLYNLNAIMHYDSIDDVIKDDSNLIVGNPHNPRIVKRNLTLVELKLYEEVDLDEDESSQVDHLVFLVHGIGEFCDMRFRTIREVVDDFRKLSLQLIREHFNANAEACLAGRVEFIPVYWHGAVHGQETGNDKQLRLITLPSIPKLRDFTNDTILDALFYTSPVYCQLIVDTVARELNQLYDLFLCRNPAFNGTVAVSGHSLGSLILFDILANQSNLSTSANDCGSSAASSVLLPSSTTGQPLVRYPMLNFKPSCFFALGSPIAMFLTIRGVKNIGHDFRLPTCRKMYNIFHPFDPVAYRIEPLVNADYAQLQPITLPHHKGRKRMHLQIKENLMKVSTDIKEKVLSGIRQTWNSVNSIVRLAKQDETSVSIEPAPQPLPSISSIAQAAVKQMSCLVDELDDDDNNQSKIDAKRPIGQLNDGERLDFVLQEKPIEFINEYIFALATHACYWQSEDTCIRPLSIRPSQTFTYMPFSSIPMLNQFASSASVQSSNEPSVSSSPKDEAIIEFK
jgi:hypothetical protein